MFPPSFEGGITAVDVESVLSGIRGLHMFHGAYDLGSIHWGHTIVGWRSLSDDNVRTNIAATGNRGQALHRFLSVLVGID